MNDWHAHIEEAEGDVFTLGYFTVEPAGDDTWAVYEHGPRMAEGEREHQGTLPHLMGALRFMSDLFTDDVMADLVHERLRIVAKRRRLEDL